MAMTASLKNTMRSSPAAWEVERDSLGAMQSSSVGPRTGPAAILNRLLNPRQDPAILLALPLDYPKPSAVYAVIVSPGYYAQRGEWPFVALFAALLALTVLFLALAARRLLSSLR